MKLRQPGKWLVELHLLASQKPVPRDLRGEFVIPPKLSQTDGQEGKSCNQWEIQVLPKGYERILFGDLNQFCFTYVQHERLLQNMLSLGCLWPQDHLADPVMQ